ncbi:glycoside hydrolase family 7 protein [Bipolaris victoriae FI3]|uniref:Glucanase n=2 Tax=Bipolaris TaxID=33194 RepID=W6YAQ9_COCC2|nr:glycoside hydrolase family 7 protein [Bipolaris zeicola 26-R-13]XP_014556870.1 glycoside hydrolase family 7 protein [Bipolaris victoriae FI3]EUC34615.1 glycoside hydrolase family 7 protein [Bipolaris zeicola 26-R-13]
MYRTLAFASLSLYGAARAQQVGTSTAENHPKLTWQTCTGTGGTNCSNKSGSVVLDSNWRWAHNVGGYTNCYTGNSWSTQYCPDGDSCTKNCAIDGADYSGTYGITTSNNALSLKFVTKGSFSSNIGSRTYLMETDTKYQMFNLINKEFTFDVDVSKLPCGLNGALYFVEMAADGGIGKGNNKAGAKYGTGYCDSQCPHDIKFINGKANVEGWNPSDADPNGGAGKIGACCPEMDIWEANSISTAYTPHPCRGVGLQECSDAASCGDGSNRYDGQCDKDGCDFNSYRMGVKDFYGPGATLDTTKKMTVITQFLGSGSSLSEIKRFYVQNGKVYKNSQSAVAGVTGNSITESFCTAQKKAFGDTSSFAALGGLNEMGASLARGHVLVMSLWDDHAVNMLWLDSTYPTDADPSKPGAARGTCPTTSGKPEDVEKNSPDATVVFSNIKFGPIGSTFAQPA